jgi:hypothetical protein
MTDTGRTMADTLDVADALRRHQLRVCHGGAGTLIRTFRGKPYLAVEGEQTLSAETSDGLRLPGQRACA